VKSRKVKWIALFTAAAALVATVRRPTRPRRRSRPARITIGASLTMTGPLGPFGLPEKDGYSRRRRGEREGRAHARREAGQAQARESWTTRAIRTSRPPRCDR